MTLSIFDHSKTDVLQKGNPKDVVAGAPIKFRLQNMREAESIQVDQIILDETNPRIKHHLEMYTSISDEAQMLLALGAGAAEEGGDTAEASFNRLKHSIRASRGIIQPIIVKPTGGRSYLCIEGNTRVAIYRELKREDEAAGRGTDQWNRIPAIVDTLIDDEETHRIRLQVHLVGNRPWDAYSKAKYLHELVEDYKMPLSELVDYCGGSQNDVRQSIAAYRDMEAHYRPVVEADPSNLFNPSRFSAFVELQKPGVKPSLYEAGYDEKDFSEWIDSRKLAPLATVRKLPQILSNPDARRVFLRDGARSAIKELDAPDLDTKLREANVSQLTRALQEKLDILSFDESQEIARNENSEEYLDLSDLYTTIRQLLGLETE